MREAFNSYAMTIRECTGLTTSPVAVKFLAVGNGLKDWPVAVGHRFCQCLMRARHGERLLLTPDSISCPAAAAALGFKPLPEKLEKGTMLVNLGIFQDARKGANTIRSMPKLEPGICQAVVFSPLELADFKPDVILVEGEVEKLMWLTLAHVNAIGSRVNFSTGVLQAVCVDCAVLPFLKGGLNLSYGCYGCRDATDIMEGEAVLGFADGLLDSIVDNLSFLANKTIPRCRTKGAYTSLQAKLIAGADPVVDHLQTVEIC